MFWFENWNLTENCHTRITSNFTTILARLGESVHLSKVGMTTWRFLKCVLFEKLWPVSKHLLRCMRGKAVEIDQWIVQAAVTGGQGSEKLSML